MWVTSEKDDPKGWVTGIAAGGSNDHEGRKVVWPSSQWAVALDCDGSKGRKKLTD